MEQTFALVYYGRISISDQRRMTSEERGWYYKRIRKEMERRAEAESRALHGGSPE